MDPLSPQDLSAYAALTTGAVWWESHDAIIAFRGDKAVDALNGLVTNDVAATRPDECMHAAALTPKGKLVADMLIVRVDDTNLLTIVSPAAATAWLDLTRKYVNPRLCKVTDESALHRVWKVYGAQSPQVAELLRSAGLDVVRAPSMGSLPGLLVIARNADRNLMLAGTSMPKGTEQLWELVRIEAGRPAMGEDMDENTLAQEANLDTLGAISFSKGCYTGQETVARVHFRGHVNRHLRGLIGTAPFVRGAQLVDDSGKAVGEVRSSAISPRFGPIALAMVRREVATGATVTVDGGHGARVVDLPFGDEPG